MIELQDISVIAPDGETTILHPTTLTLSEQRVSIIGANGSGKSTMARLINGLVEPTSGAVTVTAYDLKHSTAVVDRRPLDTVRDGAAVRRCVGFVFTDPAAQLIMPTVIEDVSLSLRRQHRNKHERRAAALAVLENYGLKGLAERSVHTLSGGQKQLLAIASVLATGPGILVADEPTTLLDLRNARLISELLLGIEQQVVIVTHDLDLASRADRTLVVDDGRVVFDGQSKEAVKHYRELAAAS